jgi:phosphoribosylanthranilate isomerase
MKVKICGMKYPDNILEVSSLYQIIWDLSFGENHRGFDGIIPTLPGSIKKVGVF